MSVKWTKEQQNVIDLQDRNILVSAAAGSGKTAVLVERIITMLTRRRSGGCGSAFDRDVYRGSGGGNEREDPGSH